MSKPKTSKTALAAASQETVAVQTLGGRMHVRWDETTQATPHVGVLRGVPDHGRRVRALGRGMSAELHEPQRAANEIGCHQGLVVSDADRFCSLTTR